MYKITPSAQAAQDTQQQHDYQTQRVMHLKTTNKIRVLLITQNNNTIRHDFPLVFILRSK